jgi:hypothetical protein
VIIAKYSLIFHTVTRTMIKLRINEIPPVYSSSCIRRIVKLRKVKNVSYFTLTRTMRKVRINEILPVYSSACIRRIVKLRKAKNVSMRLCKLRSVSDYMFSYLGQI